jgi:hypothetical protein
VVGTSPYAFQVGKIEFNEFEAPTVGPLRAWMLLFVDYIATKQIIGPALNSLVGGPSKLYEGSRAQIQGAIDSLVKRAIKSGDIRRDLEHSICSAPLSASPTSRRVLTGNKAPGDSWTFSLRVRGQSSRRDADFAGYKRRKFSEPASDFSIQLWRTCQSPDQFAYAVRDIERLCDRRSIEQSKSAGCRDHRALSKFLGIASQRCRFQPANKNARRIDSAQTWPRGHYSIRNRSALLHEVQRMPIGKE